MEHKYRVRYTYMIGGETVEFVVGTEELKKILDAVENNEICLHLVSKL